jgi:hypothetical protein
LARHHFGGLLFWNKAMMALVTLFLLVQEQPQPLPLPQPPPGMCFEWSGPKPRVVRCPSLLRPPPPPFVTSRPDPEVTGEQAEEKKKIPVFSGATVNIIRNLKQHEWKVEREILHNDSCCWPPWDKTCCFHPQTGKW